MSIKVRPIRSAWGRIQGWAVEHKNRELAFRKSHAEAMNVAQRLVA